MVKALLRLPFYCCIATVFAELIYFGYLYSEGRIDRGKVNEIAAVVYGVDRLSISEYRDSLYEPPFQEPVDLDALKEQEVSQNLDLDLRESGFEKGISNLNFYQQNLIYERQKYESLRQEFEKQFAALGGDDISEDVQEMRYTLEMMAPAKAKDQLLRLFELSEETGNEEIANDAVAIIKTMPIDKRRKIIAEFKTPAEADKLSEIFRLIRLGVPEVPLIQATRAKLNEFSTSEMVQPES